MSDCKHESPVFDRTICPEPCGSMHNYCGDCGQLLDECPHQADHPNYRRMLRQQCDTSEELMAENERLRRIENAARAVVAARDGSWSYRGLTDEGEALLDALAAEVERADEGEKR